MPPARHIETTEENRNHKESGFRAVWNEYTQALLDDTSVPYRSLELVLDDMLAEDVKYQKNERPNIPRDFEESVKSMKARVESTNTGTSCISHTRHGVATHVRFHGCAGPNDPFMSVAIEYVRESYSDEAIRREFAMVQQAGGQNCEILKNDRLATDQI